MIKDNNLVLSDSQVVTVTADSENIIDTLAAGDALHDGARFRASTKVAATDAGSDATLTVELKTSADNVTYVTLFSSGALAFAAFSPAGTRLVDIEIPLGVRRYLKAVYTVATGPLTAGAFDAFIGLSTEKLLDRGL